MGCSSSTFARNKREALLLLGLLSLVNTIYIVKSRELHLFGVGQGGN